MNIEDYALDVGKTVDEIKALCDKIGIEYKDESTVLDETDIILLDLDMPIMNGIDFLSKLVMALFWNSQYLS